MPMVMRRWLVGIAVALVGCSPGESVAIEDEETLDAAAHEQEDAEAAPAAPATAETGSAAPDRLLSDWFERIESGGDAEALFAPGGAPDILDPYAPVTLTEYEVGDAAVEGAAGSLYATVPVRLALREDMTGEEVSLEGTIVLRRVNDVPGATADQLRWHFESADLAER